ncbi:hypothetical protein LUZ60_015819 [Juncus effusus]|nr:hypothetical protein LUZ60_015819 [Juncus effusus]
MTLKITQELKSKAEVYYGDAISQEKIKLLLKEVGLPTGLLPLKDILEVGYLEETGFVWLKQKKKIEHMFKAIGKMVSYASEITAHVEKGRIKNVNGVKVKEILLWVPVYEISVDDPPTGKLTCKSTGGISKTFPTSAFELPEETKEVKTVNNEKNEVKAVNNEKNEVKTVDQEKNEVKTADQENNEKKTDDQENNEKETGADMAIKTVTNEQIFAPVAQAVANK